MGAYYSLLPENTAHAPRRNNRETAAPVGLERPRALLSRGRRCRSQASFTNRPAGTSPAITPADLSVRLYAFAHDSMMGREAATEGGLKAARYLASVVGKAHGRQMDNAARAEWRRQLLDHRGADIEAPSWLWQSVVDLSGTHESGYLEHCRRYALRAAA